MGVFMINAAFAAINFGLLYAYGYWWNLAAGIFCAVLAVATLITMRD